jgi:phage-related protein
VVLCCDEEKNALKRVVAKFYKNKVGNEPVRDWLLGLDKKDRVSIGADIQTTEYGWPIGMPTCRPMGNGLHEVRTSLTNNRIARVLFIIYRNNLILLHGFIKKTEATSKADLDLAKTRKKEVEK